MSAAESSNTYTPQRPSTPEAGCARILPSPLSEDKARWYYYGTPSCTVLVARTGRDRYPWTRPSPTLDNLEVLPVPRELRPGSSLFRDVWDTACPEIFKVLNAHDPPVRWTSINAVSFRPYDDDIWTNFYPQIAWIGVPPGSLSGEDGARAVEACKKVLVDMGVESEQFEVEMMEMVVHRGPLDTAPEKKPKGKKNGWRRKERDKCNLDL